MEERFSEQQIVEFLREAEHGVTRGVALRRMCTAALAVARSAMHQRLHLEQHRSHLELFLGRRGGC